MSPYRRVHIVINPASGADRPVLSVLNSAFGPSGIEWEVFITKKSGDARRFAQEALESGADALAVYGGDGTVMEAAGALLGSKLPLAVLPGGTTNALALALGIPADLAAACALLTSDEGTPRAYDVGRLDNACFLVAVGIGVPGAIAARADRGAKDRLGLLAYALESVQATLKVETARYHIVTENQTVDCEGVACIVANSGMFGIPGLPLASSIHMDDGLLDVVLFKAADLASIVSLAASVAAQSEAIAPFEHWQARRVTISTDPPQPAQADGEVLDPGPISAEVAPGALNILVPRAAA